MEYYNTRIYEPRFEKVTSNSIYSSEASGAFFGAFAAFIFGLMAYFIQKKFERYFKHKYATVELEHLLQEHLDRSSGNQYLLEEAKSTIQTDVFPFTLLNTFELPKDISLRLGELALINRYFDYHGTVVRINHSLLTWQKLNEKIQEASIAGALSENAKKKNLTHLYDQGEILIKFLKSLDDETEWLVAYTRVFMRKDKFIWSINWQKWNNNLKVGEDLVSEKLVQAEIKEMQKEIKEIQKISKEKIAKIMA